MDEERLAAVLRDQFDPAEGQLRAVVRQARDLADSGRYERDAGRPLAPDLVAGHLADAPDGGLADRWNWWLGSLELAYGGYAEFQVRAYRDGE